MPRKGKPLHKYPVRICRTMHACCLCPHTIFAGQAYYDGGLDRRAHVKCAEPPKVGYAKPIVNTLDQSALNDQLQSTTGRERVLRTIKGTK